MDTSRWKSVAVSIDVYNMLKTMAVNNDRSVSKQAAFIVKQAFNQLPNTLEAVPKKAAEKR